MYTCLIIATSFVRSVLNKDFSSSITRPSPLQGWIPATTYRFEASSWIVCVSSIGSLFTIYGCKFVETCCINYFKHLTSSSSTSCITYFNVGCWKDKLILVFSSKLVFCLRKFYKSRKFIYYGTSAPKCLTNSLTYINSLFYDCHEPLVQTTMKSGTTICSTHPLSHIKRSNMGVYTHSPLP